MVIRGEMANWTATAQFDLPYFRSLYAADSALAHHRRHCQFFRYRTGFRTLGDALHQLHEPSNGTWYIGWSVKFMAFTFISKNSIQKSIETAV